MTRWSHEEVKDIYLRAEKAESFLATAQVALEEWIKDSMSSWGVDKSCTFCAACGSKCSESQVKKLGSFPHNFGCPLLRAEITLKKIQDVHIGAYYNKCMANAQDDYDSLDLNLEEDDDVQG